MSIIQFLRILWARRILVVVAFLAAVLGAFVVVTLVQPRYEATARVNMDILKQDPLSGGGGVDIRNAGVYFDAQQELVKDYSVAGPVVDRLGWLYRRCGCCRRCRGRGGRRCVARCDRRRKRIR